MGYVLVVSHPNDRLKSSLLCGFGYLMDRVNRIHGEGR